MESTKRGAAKTLLNRTMTNPALSPMRQFDYVSDKLYGALYSALNNQ